MLSGWWKVILIKGINKPPREWLHSDKKGAETRSKALCVLHSATGQSQEESRTITIDASKWYS